jgi:hypothetical protein
MSKNPVKIEVVQDDDGRFIVRTFADGREERLPIVKLPRKPPRWRYRKVSLDRSRKKGF